jgi:hypothetical protein
VTVGHTTFALPGVGSYVALAIAQKNLAAIGWAIATMLIVILLYDQLLVPAAGGLGGPLPGRAGTGCASAGILGAHHDAALAHDHKRRRWRFTAAVLWTSRAVKRSDAPAIAVSTRPKRSSICCGCSLVVAAVVLGLWHIVAVLLKHIVA